MDTKQSLLEAAGFRYNFDRMAYINRRAKKVFAVETVDDHSEEWLVERIAAPNTTGDWQFYDEPAASVRRDFIVELENGRVANR